MCPCIPSPCACCNPCIALARLADVFPHGHGRTWFQTCCQHAGVKAYNWHDNRHAFAGRLRMAGVDLITIADLLGHRDLKMMRRYAHIGHGALAAQLARLPESIPETISTAVAPATDFQTLSFSNHIN
jgi:hypothetical protein